MANETNNMRYDKFPVYIGSKLPKQQGPDHYSRKTEFMSQYTGGVLDRRLAQRSDLRFSVILALFSASAFTAFDQHTEIMNMMGLTTIFFAFLYMRRQAYYNNYLITVFFAVVYLFSLFTWFVINFQERVAVEFMFDFSAFHTDALINAFWANTLALAVGVAAASIDQRIYSKASIFLPRNASLKRARGSEPAHFLVSLGILSVALLIFFITPNTHQIPYPENLYAPRSIDPGVRGGLVVIVFGVFLYYYASAKFKHSVDLIVLRATFYASSYLICIAAGPRGAVVGMYLILLAVDYVLCSDGKLRKVAIISLNISAILFAVVNWPKMRSQIADVGWWSAFGDSHSAYGEFLDFRLFSTGDIFFSEIPMLGQSLFHFLYVIALVDAGDGNQFRTFINLLPQQLPEPLDGVLWDRPIADAWLIGDYYVGSGGFYSIANAYWNGGAWVALVFTGALGWLFSRIEVYFKSALPMFVIGYAVFMFLVPNNMYYGIQALVRGLEYGLFATIVLKLVSRYLPKSAVY